VIVREHGKITKSDAVEILSSPRDGEPLRRLTTGAEFEILGSESWLRVRLPDGTVGFLLEDYVEPVVVQARVEQRLVEVTTFVSSLGPRSPYQGKPIRCDIEFIPAIEELEGIAIASGVEVIVISSLREPARPVDGAVVTPATYSNHFVGHAIDFNLLDGGRAFRSSDLLSLVPEVPGEELVQGNVSLGVREFIQSVRSSDLLRWGGDFSSPDPTHIDDQLNLKRPEVYKSKLAALWGQGVLELLV